MKKALLLSLGLTGIMLTTTQAATSQMSVEPSSNNTSVMELKTTTDMILKQHEETNAKLDTILAEINTMKMEAAEHALIATSPIPDVATTPETAVMATPDVTTMMIAPDVNASMQNENIVIKEDAAVVLAETTKATTTMTAPPATAPSTTLVPVEETLPAPTPETMPSSPATMMSVEVSPPTASDTSSSASASSGNPS
ncbi:MAG: hypothetical protein WCG04_02190 [Alphaproteobacteria bacterium]